MSHEHESEDHTLRSTTAFREETGAGSVCPVRADPTLASSLTNLDNGTEFCVVNDAATDRVYGYIAGGGGVRTTS